MPIWEMSDSRRQLVRSPAHLMGCACSRRKPSAWPLHLVQREGVHLTGRSCSYCYDIMLLLQRTLLLLVRVLLLLLLLLRILLIVLLLLLLVLPATYEY